MLSFMLRPLRISACCFCGLLFLSVNDQSRSVCAIIGPEQCFACDQGRFEHIEWPIVIVDPLIEVRVVAVAQSGERRLSSAVEMRLEQQANHRIGGSR